MNLREFYRFNENESAWTRHISNKGNNNFLRRIKKAVSIRRSGRFCETSKENGRKGNKIQKKEDVK